MAVRKFKPTTPGQRHKVIGVFKGTITATTPEKSLTVGKKSSGGRNAEGHVPAGERNLIADHRGEIEVVGVRSLKVDGRGRGLQKTEYPQ